MVASPVSPKKYGRSIALDMHFGRTDGKCLIRNDGGDHEWTGTAQGEDDPPPAALSWKQIVVPTCAAGSRFQTRKSNDCDGLGIKALTGPHNSVPGLWAPLVRALSRVTISAEFSKKSSCTEHHKDPLVASRCSGGEAECSHDVDHILNTATKTIRWASEQPV